MKTFKELSDWDKTLSIILVLTLFFWTLSKTPVMEFILFDIMYELGWIFAIIAAVFCPLYFLVKWIMNRFTLKKIYFYGFLLGILTVVIMRFVFSITSSGITFMKH